jgi:hypothetical protein
MKQVILRIDDIQAHTHPAALEQIYGPCWVRGIPVCFSVIPRTAYRFESSGPVPCPSAGLSTNPALCALIADREAQGQVEITLHGWQHDYGEWAGPSQAAIAARIEQGRDRLRAVWPGAAVRVAVPPHDRLSPAGKRAIRQTGLGLCSTWAAIHGGTRRAHWLGRLRRWRNQPFAPVQRGQWATDIALLDFGGAPDDDLPVSARILHLAARWRSPVVFVQHYWRLLAPDGSPNDRFDRWLRWLDYCDAMPDLCYQRFSDG